MTIMWRFVNVFYLMFYIG
ncbi:Hypothetical protein LLA12_00264 [Lactococcus lactis subsp. lactis]|nr:Hypothetical protein LLA12_00264 [Lactococcus lactis subsp. lactis]